MSIPDRWIADRMSHIEASGIRKVFDLARTLKDSINLSIGQPDFDVPRPINRGWVSITRPWHLVSVNTGLGDPKAATADKGRRLMDALSERLGDFLADLAASEMGETFPY